MLMKCQGAVLLSFSRNLESGMVEAVSIAFAIALLSADTPRIFATWLCAAGVRLSAAMTATILCPSYPQAHADMGQSATANTTPAMQIADVRDDRDRSPLFLIDMVARMLNC